MPRNPLAVGWLTTADVIRETRLASASMSPESRRAAARAAALAMTPAERTALARRNASKVLEASGKVAEAAALAGQDGQRSAAAVVVPPSCPRCGAEARGRSDSKRADWFGGHYRTAHPEMGY